MTKLARWLTEMMYMPLADFTFLHWCVFVATLAIIIVVVSWLLEAFVWLIRRL